MLVGPARSALLVATLAVVPKVASAAPDNGRQACVASYEQAQQLRQANDLVNAYAELESCVKSCPEKLANDCSKWKAELEGYLPRVVVQAVNADGSPADVVALLLDGRPVVADSSGAIRLAPGPHTIRVDAKDGSTGTLEKTFPVEERETRVRITVRRSDATTSTSPPSGSSGAASSTSDARVGTGSRVPSYALGGAGIAVLVGAGALTLAGHLERSHLLQTCAPDCKKSDADAIQTMWLVAGGVAGIGVLAVAGAVLLWPRARAARPSVSIGNGMGVLTARF